MNTPSLSPNNKRARNADPFRLMTQLQNQVDQLFDNFQEETMLSPTTWQPETYLPTCDVEETADHYVMSMDVPGMKKEDIKIELRNGLLSISGERKEEKEEKKKGQLRSERFYGSFSRCFSIPEEVKAEQIETEYKDGVLHLAIPKVESAKAAQIKVGEQKPGFFERFLKKEPKTLEAKGMH